MVSEHVARIALLLRTTALLQAQQAKLDKRVPVVDTKEKAAAMAQLMCILQQHHHPLLCRSYMVPCFVTSATTGMVFTLLADVVINFLAAAFLTNLFAHAPLVVKRLWFTIMHCNNALKQ
jgi:hypothetical protein